MFAFNLYLIFGQLVKFEYDVLDWQLYRRPQIYLANSQTLKNFLTRTKQELASINNIPAMQQLWTSYIGK